MIYTHVYIYIHIIYTATSNEWNSWQNYPWDEPTKWWYFTTSQIPDPAAESAHVFWGKTVVLGCEINKKLWSSSKPPNKKNIVHPMFFGGSIVLVKIPKITPNLWSVRITRRWSQQMFCLICSSSLGSLGKLRGDFVLLISVCIYIYNYYIKLNIDIIYICMYVACPKLFSAAQIF